MTRQDLVDILKLDGTYQEIETAIAESELTEQERDSICEFLREEDPVVADQLFEKILQDIASKPVYENGKEEQKAWKNFRQEIAIEIKELNQKAHECEDHIQNCETKLDEMKKFFGEDRCKELEKLINEDIEQPAKELMIKTKQISALSLMHTEARSMEAQALGRIMLENTEPVRKAIGFAWDGVTYRAKTLVNNMKQTIDQNRDRKDMIRQTDNLTFHPIKNLVNQYRVIAARSHVKEYNKINSKIDKIENKLMKEANKITKAEAKPKIMDRLEAWSKGEKVQPKEPEVIQDVERAKEIISASKKHSERWEEKRTKALGDLKAMRDNAEKKATYQLERIANTLEQRKELAEEYQQKFGEQIQNGELGNYDRSNKAHKGIDEITSNLAKAHEDSRLDASSFGKDLDDMLKFIDEHENLTIDDFLDRDR